MKKRKSFFCLKYKKIINCILFELSLLLFFSLCIYSSLPSYIMGTQKVDIVVKDTSLEYGTGRSSVKFYVYSDSDRFFFPNQVHGGYHSNYELSEIIQKGEEISIIYTKYWSWTSGMRNMVVDARSQTEVYRSIVKYDSDKEPMLIIMIVSFLIFQSLYVFIAVKFIFAHERKQLKNKSEREKRKAGRQGKTRDG